MGSTKKGKQGGGYGPSAVGLVGYKYEPGSVQVSSDPLPDTMRLLALLLMVGAAGKDTNTHIHTYLHTRQHTHTQTHTSAISKI